MIKKDMKFANLNLTIQFRHFFPVLRVVISGFYVLFPQSMCNHKAVCIYTYPKRLSKVSFAAPVAEWVRSLYFSALNHSIISPLCLVKVRVPHWPHVGQDKFCLRVSQVVLPGYSRFAPPIDWLVSMSEISLKGTLN